MVFEGGKQTTESTASCHVFPSATLAYLVFLHASLSTCLCSQGKLLSQHFDRISFWSFLHTSVFCEVKSSSLETHKPDKEDLRGVNASDFPESESVRMGINYWAGSDPFFLEAVHLDCASELKITHPIVILSLQ